MKKNWIKQTKNCYFNYLFKKFIIINIFNTLKNLDRLKKMKLTKKSNKKLIKNKTENNLII